MNICRITNTKLILFASFEVVNADFNPTLLQPDDYVINPIGFWMAWISFLATGWFISYKIRQYGISPRYYHAIAFFIAQYLMLRIVSVIGLVMFNPEFLSGTYSNPNFLVSSYFLFIPDFYLSTFLSGGFFMYAFGYKFLWKAIYEITPRSELEPILAEL